MIQLLFYTYAMFLLGVIGFQVALIAGAPWGRITQGGRHEGPLPMSGRIAAALSILILIGFALSMSSRAGLPPSWPRWTGWAALLVQALSMLANWATRSQPERRLWAPITSLMLALASSIMVLSEF